MKRHADVRVHASERVFGGRIFDLVSESIELPSGLRQDLVVVDHPGAVCIAPVLDTGELVLVRQYRHAAGDWLTEIPAGRLEPGEDPETAARRELEEETGYRAAHWERATAFLAAPGFCSEVLTLFVARGLEEVPGGGLPQDDDEELELVTRTPEAILAGAVDGHGGGAVQDAKTLVAAAWVLRARQS